MYAPIVSALHAYLLPLFESQFPGVPLVFENQAFDWNNLPDKFVEVEVKFYGASQVGASSNPKTRAGGFVYVTTYAREGQGTLLSLQYLDFFSQTLGYQNVGTMRLQAPELVDGSSPKGWHTKDLKVSFYADQQ